MLKLNTIHEKKSAVKTAVVMGLLILSFFYVGMKYLDPPEEMGIEINFGTSDVGSGDVQPTKPVQQVSQQETPKEEELVEEETITEKAQENAPSEDVATQELEESIRINKEAEAKRKVQEEAARKAREKQEAEKRKKAEADRIKSEREAKKNELDNLMGGLNKSDGTTTGGEGNDNSPGDKGQLDGNPYANSYFGSGNGGSSGFGLKGRNRISFKKIVQSCNEVGRVVVQIEVNRSGKVVKAIPGVKGSTNTAACLLVPAKKTALSYRFNPDAKAPTKQIGFIVINFSLGE